MIPHPENQEKIPWSGRLFFGLPVSQPDREAIRSRVEAWGKLPGRAVPIENWHLTLCFLGHLTEPVARKLAAQVSEQVWGPPFSLALGHPGAFPKTTRARVFWVGSAEESGSLENARGIAERLAMISRELEIEVDRKEFVPHLTLSRMQLPLNLEAYLRSVPRFRYEARFDEFALFRSDMSQGQVAYQPLARFPLTWLTAPPRS